jgi:hypothetical protein
MNPKYSLQWFTQRGTIGHLSTNSLQHAKGAGKYLVATGVTRKVSVYQRTSKGPRLKGHIK